MRCIVQRVKKASVTIDNLETKSINNGIMVLCAFEDLDTFDKIDFVAEKIVNLRIFSDSDDKLNLSLKDINGEILIVSNFTLYGDCAKGRRPSFVRAGKPSVSKGMYDYFVEKVKSTGLKVETGKFGADMLVDISNDGPVTLVVEK